MTEQKFRPIVLGADTLGYSYARELYRCYGVVSTMLSGAVIKYSEKSRFTDYHVVENIDREEVIMQWLRSHAGTFGDEIPIVLGGASDWHVRTLSKHKPELESLGYVIPYIDFALLDRITQKDQFYAACDKLGIPYPKTWVVPFGDDYDTSVVDGTSMRVVREIAEIRALAYPLIAKPSNSADWHYAKIPDRHKVYKINDPDTMEKLVRDISVSGYSHSLLLQEVLSDSDESLHSLTTFSDASGEVILGVSGNVLVQDRSATGIGNPLVILGDQRRRDLLDAASRLCREFGYEGYANFDVMNNAAGEPHFLEVNTRPGRNTYYVSLAGCPFVKPIIEYYIYHRDLRNALTATEQKAENPFLFCMVPRAVVAKETHDDRRERALRLFGSRTAGSPLLCREDTLPQRFWARVNYEHMRSRF